ncbi:hypothetical protein Tco_1115799 [Tanacetum coccineum]
MDLETTQNNVDYTLWDVIENGNSFNPAARTTTNADGTSTSTIPGPVTTKEKAQKELVSEKEKQTIFPTKIKFFKQQDKTARKPVKPKIVNTARPHSAVVNEVRANQVNAVKASTCWVWRPTKPASASITLKKHNLHEADPRGVRGGKITGKGTFKTGKLDFQDVFFVKELKFNLFSVSKMCDKKNCVLFTDTACFVLSPDFKLPDESQILLKIPRKNNMYSVDMKNIIPKENLTCLVAKATLDESML